MAGLVPLTILTLLTIGAAVVGIRSPEAEQYRPDPRWAEAQQRLVDANTGRFRFQAVCAVTDEFDCHKGRVRFAHFGSFTIEPVAVDYRQRAPMSPVPQDTRKRRLADGTTFELFAPVSSCWVAIPPGESNDSLDYGSDLPVGMRILLETRVVSSATGNDDHQLIGSAPLDLVLRLFLIPRWVQPEIAAGPHVPVLIRLSPDGAPASLAVKGADLATAFAGTEVDTDGFAGVFRHDVRFTVDKLGLKTQFESPPEKEILAGPAFRGTCTEPPRR